MRIYLRLFLMELKKNLRMLPFVFLSAVAAALFLSLFIRLLSNSLYEEGSLARAKVALITNDAEDEYMQLALRYITNMSSTSLALDYEVMEKDKALRALQKHDVIAVMFFPDDVMGGIMWGRNDPIEIRFSDTDALSSVFLSELTRSGALMLSAAQADTYSATDLYYELGAQDSLYDAYNDIDMMNFDYVLSREKLFTASETLPVFLSYIASALLLFLFFSSSAFAPALRMEDRAFTDLLFSGKALSAGYLAVRFLANWLVLSLFSVVCCIAASLVPELPFDISVYADAQTILSLVLISGVLSAFALFLHQASGSAPVSVLLQLTLSVGMLFCSGGILPAAFLPKGLLHVGTLLPTAPLSADLLQLLTGEGETHSAALLLWMAGLFAAACIAFRLRISQKGGKRA
ncbi:MAG: ABC transporter permease [Lachnospiraceae bacterium]|nr:ABC transporter permease [Lachnospiraceae bacterium]